MLTTLVLAMPSHALDFVISDKQKNFLTLLPDKVTNKHKKIASLGFSDDYVTSSYVKFNLDGLNIITDNEKNKFITVKNIQMTGQSIALRLPDFENDVLLQVDSAQHNIKRLNMVTYSGIVGKDKHSHFILTISDNEGVVGKISLGQYLYVISPVDNSKNLHTIVKLNKALIPRISDEFKDKEKSISSTVVNRDTPKDNNKYYYNYGHVSILFYVASDVTSPNSLVSGVISEMNTAFFNSGVYFHSVYNSSDSPVVLNTTFPNQCRSAITDKFRYKYGEFANIDQDLLVHGADIAFLIVGDTSPGTSNCFQGYPGRVGGKASWFYDASNASAMSARAYVLGDLTALHEIGHVMGGKHSDHVYTTYLGASNSPESTKGYTDPNDNWQTIMGGYTECPFNGIYSNCERLLQFSNPNVLYYHQGQATGEVYNKDMSLWLNNSMYAISQWRGSPLAIPSTPNPISVQSEHCYGFNRVNWTAKYGATSYKLYKSTSSNFTNPMLIYSGANTNSFINVGVGTTWYLKAQACNAAGCSVNSSQVSAGRYNGCL